jgi:hypothetical protein
MGLGQGLRYIRILGQEIRIFSRSIRIFSRKIVNTLLLDLKGMRHTTNMSLYKVSPNLKALTFVSALIFPAYIGPDPLLLR